MTDALARQTIDCSVIRFKHFFNGDLVFFFKHIYVYVNVKIMWNLGLFLYNLLDFRRIIKNADDFNRAEKPIKN